MMNFLSVIPIIGKILDKGLDVVDEMVEDKDLAQRLKNKIKEKVLVQNHEENMKLLDAQMKVIVTEASGSWLQRNWRPLLMLMTIVIIFNNYVLFPYLSIFTDKVTILTLPDGLWKLLVVGVGGYVLGRSGEKVIGDIFKTKLIGKE